MDPALKLLDQIDEAFFIPTVDVMGRKVGIDCMPGVVESVEDASYTQSWNDHVGTDCSSIPIYLGNNRWVRDEIYTHHYVERSQTVARNKITLRLDERGDTRRSSGRSKSWTMWFGSNVEFAPGDRVVLVAADIETLILVNETRRYQVFTGMTHSGEPEPEDALQAFGRFLDRPLLAAGLLVVLALGAWKASAILPALLCWAVPVLFAVLWRISATSWNARRAVFRNKVRDACETALLRLEKVRAGASLRKAHEDTFGDDSGMAAATAFRPWWISVCEALGATALPPVRSRQWYGQQLEDMQERQARRGAPATDEERRRAEKALDAASREFGRVYVEYEGNVPFEIVEQIGHREDMAKRAPHPKRHVRRRGDGHFEDQWQIHWGRPRWSNEMSPITSMYLFRARSWFDEAVRNGTIPPLPPEVAEKRWSTRSLADDPMYPGAQITRPKGYKAKAA